MAKAIWNGEIIAQSETFEIVEGNYYFPPNSIKREFLKESNTHSTCPWKGVANYYDVVIKSEINKDAAGIILIQNPQLNKSKTMLLFGKELQFKNNPIN